MTVLADYLPESELANQLKVSTRTTARYRHEEGLPYVEVGNRVYVRRADVDAWLIKRSVKRNSKPQAKGAPRSATSSSSSGGLHEPWHT